MTAMQLLSVNVSLPKEVPYNGETMTTGIYKEPIQGRVMMRELNIDGDKQADLQAHGGPFKAVYVYPYEHYAHWSDVQGRDDFTYGQFGENLTVTGMLEDTVRVGDMYCVGGAIIQVTQPRIPCYKLSYKMNDNTFLKKFLTSDLIGFYVRVLEEGEIGAGDDIELVKADPVGMTVKDIHRLLHFDKQNVEAAKRALQIESLAPGWQGAFQEHIEKYG